MDYKKLARSLLSEGRTNHITKRRFFELYEEKIGIPPDKLPEIYRGKEGEPTYGYIEPAQYSRKSAWTENYYTLIIDHSKTWDRYPERSESIVCTTSMSKAEDFGNIFRVFPLPGSKIGVCSDRDIWDSFHYLEEETGIWDLKNFNSVLRKLTNVCFDSSLDEENWDSFKKKINQIPECESFEHLYQEDEYPSEIDQFLVPFKTKMKNLAEYYYPNYNTFYEMVDDLLDPEKNNFELETFTSGTGLPGDVEVWTDGPSLLIPINKVDRLKNFYKQN